MSIYILPIHYFLKRFIFSLNNGRKRKKTKRTYLFYTPMFSYRYLFIKNRKLFIYKTHYYIDLVIIVPKIMSEYI